jgi:hypothetical protein
MMKTGQEIGWGSCPTPLSREIRIRLNRRNQPILGHNLQASMELSKVN